MIKILKIGLPIHIIKQTIPYFFNVFKWLLIFYFLFPVQFWKNPLLPTQIELFFVTTCLAIICILFYLFKLCTPNFNIELEINSFDILLFFYTVYIILRSLVQDIHTNIEIYYQVFSLCIIYIFFKINISKIQWYYLLAFPVAGIAQIVYGIKKQTLFFVPGYGFSDITGTYLNTGILGGFVALTVVIAVSLLSQLNFTKISNNRKLLLSFLFMTGMLLLVIQLIASNSRTAWLICFFGIITIVIDWRKFKMIYQGFSFLKKVRIAVIASSLIVIIFCGLFHMKKESAEGRLLIWRISLEMIKEKPLFGYGIDGFKANYMDFQAKYLQQHPKSPYISLADDNQFAFNEFLKIGVEYGSFGLILLFTLIYLILIDYHHHTKKPNIENNLVCSAKLFIRSYIIFCFFSYPMEYFQHKVILIFFTAIASSDLSSVKKIQISSFIRWDKSKNIFQKILFVCFSPLIISILLLLLSSLFTHSLAYKKWFVALLRFRSGDPSESTKMLGESYHQLQYNPLFLTTYGVALNASGDYRQAILSFQAANRYASSSFNYNELGKCYEANGEYEKAENAWKMSSLMIPSKFSPKYNLVKMLYKIGKTKEAKEMARELLTKNPKIRSPDLQIIFEEMNAIMKKPDN